MKAHKVSTILKSKKHFKVKIQKALNYWAMVLKTDTQRALRLSMTTVKYSKHQNNLGTSMYCQKRK